MDKAKIVKELKAKGNDYTCDVCEKWFMNPQALKWHSLKHQTEKLRKEAKLLKKDFFEPIPEKEPEEKPTIILPKKEEAMEKETEETAICGNCNTDVRVGMRVCSACGDELMW